MGPGVFQELQTCLKFGSGERDNNQMELPSSVYYVTGILVLANLGTIGSVIVMGAKFVWWMAQHDLQMKQNTRDINAAHTKIRSLERLPPLDKDSAKESCEDS